MKVGDLDKYKAHVPHLQHLVGVVADMYTDNCRRTRAQMLWNDPTRNWLWSWVSELEIVNESR